MQKIRIDFDNPGLPQHISAVENDSQSRFFQATLYENGKAYSAPEGATYSIMYSGFGPQNQGWYDTINDGAGKRAACAVSGNVVTCEIARQALQVPGHVSIVLCVTTGKGYMLKSWPIECDCKNDRYDSTVEIQSFFYVTQISNESWTQAIQAVEDLKNTIDPTLSLSGKAADAAKAGETINAESERAKGVENQLKEDLGVLNGIDWNLSPFNNGYTNKIDFRFEVGNINSDGNDEDSNLRVRTSFFGSISENDYIVLTIPNIQYRLFSYDINGALVSATDYALGNKTIRLSPSKKYRMVFANEDWLAPNISSMKSSLLGFCGNLESYIKSIVKIPYANYNNALQFGFNSSGSSSMPNDEALENYLRDYADKPLFFPKGKYIFSSAIKIANGCKFFLDNEATLEYNQYGANIGDFITIEDPEAKQSYIKGGNIECNGKCTVAIKIYNTHYFSLENITINTPTIYGISMKAPENKEPCKSSFFYNLRIKKANTDSDAVDTYGIYDVGYDNRYQFVSAMDFKFGMLCGGGAKVIDCHPWQSSRKTYNGSCAYLVEHSTVELENCVIDTFQRGIKVRGTENVTVTASNLRVFNNSDVVNSGEMIVFQGTSNGLTYCYPILHISNISINDWGGTTKLVDFDIPDEIKKQYYVGGVTQRSNIINDAFTIEKRLAALENNG